MRLFAAWAAVAIGAACGPSPGPPPSTATSEPSGAVNPARIERVRTELPAQYELTGISGAAVPVALWGFGPGWTAHPPQCGALGDPAPGATTRGWSGSGPGGIVYAVVAVGATPVPDAALLAECGEWTVTSGHTTGTVTLVGAPAIADTPTVGMVTTARTVVEGGTETQSHADTFTAYLGEHVAFVTVVTDPGSPNPPLGADFASGLLVKTVSALRG